VKAPADEGVRKAIDALAAFVARNGEAFERIAKSRHSTDPKFRFLFGGDGKVRGFIDAALFESHRELLSLPLPTLAVRRITTNGRSMTLLVLRRNVKMAQEKREYQHARVLPFLPRSEEACLASRS
jgi:hypothetical protein